MRKDEEIRVRIAGEPKRRLEKEAEALDMTLAEYTRMLLTTRPDLLFAFASGEKKVSASWIRYVMDVASEECDSIEHKSGTADAFEWSSSANALIGWLKENPYHPDGPEKVRFLFGNLPDDMRAVIFGHVDRFIGVR